MKILKHAENTTTIEYCVDMNYLVKHGKFR